jgi:hypothetical protein
MGNMEETVSAYTILIVKPFGKCLFGGKIVDDNNMMIEIGRKSVKSFFFDRRFCK